MLLITHYYFKSVGTLTFLEWVVCNVRMCPLNLCEVSILCCGGEGKEEEEKGRSETRQDATRSVYETIMDWKLGSATLVILYGRKV